MGKSSTSFKKGHHASPNTEFKKGHISIFKGKRNFKISGQNNPQWKGGRKRHSGGYIVIRDFRYPPSISKSYILEHRFVMEQYLGRPIKKGEIIHHINGKRDDNRIENLKLICNVGTHRTIHTLEHDGIWSRFGHIKCLSCNSTNFQHYAKGLCRRCYPKRNQRN